MTEGKTGDMGEEMKETWEGTSSDNGEEGWEDCESPSGSNFFIKFRSPQKPPPEALLDLMGMKMPTAEETLMEMQRAIKDGALMARTEEKDAPLVGMKRARRSEGKDVALMRLKRASRTEEKDGALVGMKRRARRTEEKDGAMKMAASTEGGNGKVVDLEKKYPFTVGAFTSWGSKGAITPALVDRVKANLEAVGREAAEEFEAKWKKLHLEELRLLMDRFRLQAEHSRWALATLKSSNK